MSSTSLFAASADGDMKRAYEYSNSWWSAMAVWTFMVERYLQPAPEYWLGDKAFLRRLWGLAGEGSVPRDERIVLMTTFDHALVRGAAQERCSVVLAMQSFAARLAPENHIATQAHDILQLPASTRAIGWQQTSVVENSWWVEEKDGSNGRPYNIDRDDQHWWIFDEL